MIERANLWRISAFGGIELIRAHFKDFSFSAHTHKEYMIAVTERGEGHPRLCGKSHSVNTGEILTLNPGDITEGGPARDSVWHYRGFYPSARIMQLAARDLVKDERQIPRFSKSVISDPHLAAMLHSTLAKLEEPQHALMSESLLLDLLAYLIEHHSVDKFVIHPIGSEHQSAHRAKEYLEAFPGKNISLEELAQVTGLSPYYFCRVFHKQTGLSPHEYQLLVRVRFAKGLLVQGTPISQVAVESGFFDQSHFTRHFKRIYGVPPSFFFPEALPISRRET